MSLRQQFILRRQGRVLLPELRRLATRILEEPSITSTPRVQAFRERRKQEGRLSYDPKRKREYKRDKALLSKQSRPFIGCDGEGCGVDEKGRQLYMLFRMGERELFTGNPLGTEELLDFICDQPAGSILVGFAFGYDVTMILRDLPKRQAQRLFEKRERGKGFSPFVWYKNFNIDYLPRQYFKVCRVNIERGQDGKEKRVIVKGSTRIIYETFGFFQKSFVKAISDFEIGTPDQRQAMAADKARRGSFESISAQERAYCALECEFLAGLMDRLRDYCHAAGIVPRTWNGAGKLAGALHALHETPQKKSLETCIPLGLSDFANMAYYGGRFEISHVGNIEEKIYEYDIRSAYPSAMRFLPCLVHGRWKEVDGRECRELAHRARHGDGRWNDNLFVATCAFKARDPSRINFGGLPVRSKEGHLYWPLQGGGIYWSCEIASAERLGFSISYKGGWAYERCCDCCPFEWVESLYEYRQSIGASGAGYPIKLAINSLYGLLAQRIGNGKYTNMIWAGLITALTRTQLNDAIALDPSSIVMVATDAVYSTRALPDLICSDRLGDWEHQVLDGLFIVQPGLYWCPARRKKKSRGLSGNFFEEPGRTESFEEAWRYFHTQENSKQIVDFPAVSVPVPGFIGLKLGVARGNPDLAGRWVSDHRVISFDYRNKRQSHKWVGNHIVTRPKHGHAGLKSLPHREFLAAGGHEPWEMARLMLEEQPDYVDLGIPFKD